MRRPSTLILPLVMILAFALALLSACADLQEAAGTGDASDATDTTSTTVVVVAQDTTTESTAATTTTMAVTTTTVASTTTTTSGGSGGPHLQIDPGLLQTNPSIMQIDPNLIIAYTRCEDSHPYLHWEDQWDTKLSSQSSGGTYRASSTEGSYVEIFFNGTGVRLIAPKGIYGGNVRIVLTGNGTTRVETVSLYSSTASYQQTIWYSGHLDKADYAVYFEHDYGNVGYKVIWVDAIDIWGTVTPP